MNKKELYIKESKGDFWSSENKQNAILKELEDIRSKYSNSFKLNIQKNKENILIQLNFFKEENQIELIEREIWFLKFLRYEFTRLPLNSTKCILIREKLHCS